MESPLLNTRFAPLVQQLTDLSEEGQRISSSPDMNESKMRSALNKLIMMIRSLFVAAQKYEGFHAMELQTNLSDEILRLEKKISSKDNILNGDTRVSDVVFPIIMDIAAAIKFFIQAYSSSPTQENNSNSQASRSEEDVKKESDSFNMKRSRSQLTLDIMSFAKSCSSCISSLRSAPLMRQNLLVQVTGILNAVRPLLADDGFATSSTKASMQEFVGVVRELQKIQDEDLSGKPVIDNLLRTLTPLASEIKRTAFDLQNRRTSATEDERSPPLTLNHAKMPLHFDHNDFQKSNMFESMQDITGSFTMSSLSESTQHSIAQSPLSSYHPTVDKKTSTRISMGSTRISGAFRSVPNLTAPDIADQNSSNGASESIIKELIPTRVDVSSHIQFTVDIEVVYVQESTGRILQKKIITKSDVSVKDLWNRIEEIVPGYLHKFSFESIKRFPGKSQMQEMIIGEYALFFQAINSKPHILKSQLISSFVNEPNYPKSPLKSPLKSPSAKSPSAFFSSPLSSSKRPSASHGNLAKLDDSNAPSSPKSPTGKTGTRFSNLLRMKSNDEVIPASKDRTSKISIDESHKSSGNKLTKTKSLFNLLGAKDDGPLSGLATGSSKTITKQDNNSKKIVVMKTTLLNASPNKQQDKDKAFNEYIQPLLKKGYIKVDDITIALKNANGQDKIVLKNVDGKGRVIAGTLGDLIQRVLEERLTNEELFDCFVLTYRHLLKSHELLIKLVEHYKKSTASDSPHPEVDQMQVASFLFKWVETSWKDFEADLNLKNGLEKFLTIIKASKKIALMADQIHVMIEKQKEVYLADKQKESSAFDRPFLTNVGTAEFLSFDVFELAVQMTKFDYYLFNKIRPISLIENLWEKDKSGLAVEKWINRFNLVSYWVGTEICTTPLLKQRVQVVENMIKLLRVFKDLNNFNGMMAIISGLNMASIRRLKKTWAALNSKSVSHLHEIENLMDPQMNYQSYRDLESKCRHQQSYIPFLGLYLKDLVFANDGNPKYLPNELVNFTKNWQIYEIVKKVMVAKETPYDFPENETTYNYCQKLVALPEKRLYSYSLLCEPRENKQQTNSTSSNVSNGTTSSNGTSNNKDAELAIRLIEKWSTSK